MASKKTKPPLCGKGRPLISFESFPASNNSEVTEKARSLQEIRAVWLARRAAISTNLAETIALLAFGSEAR